MDDVESIEAAEHAAEAISKEEGRGAAKLWFGILGSPLAWAGHLVANYSLEEWFACSKSTQTRGEIMGIAVPTMTVLINTVMLLIAAASAWVAWRCWKHLRNQEGDETLERARWMAFAGVVEGALFVGIILFGYLPALTIGTCETTP